MLQGRSGDQPSSRPALTLPIPRVNSSPQTHMGGFLGSPWNFIFLDEFAVAGGARLSLSSLYGDTRKGHTHPPACPMPSDSPFMYQEGGETEAQPRSNFLTAHTCVRQALPSKSAFIIALTRLVSLPSF